jgi:hypothetical protein
MILSWRHFQKQILSEFSGEGAFEGEVSLANNGGFCAVKYVLEPIELIGTTHFSIRIKGDGTTYQFRVKSKKMIPILMFFPSRRILTGKLLKFHFKIVSSI